MLPKLWSASNIVGGLVCPWAVRCRYGARLRVTLRLLTHSSIVFPQVAVLVFQPVDSLDQSRSARLRGWRPVGARSEVLSFELVHPCCDLCNRCFFGLE